MVSEVWSYVEIVILLVTPLVIIWWWATKIVAGRTATKGVAARSPRMGVDPDGLYCEGRALMEAAALCEQRRHGRRCGDPIDVEWDQALFPRKTTDVGVHAAWLEKEGPKVGIRVVRKNPSAVSLPGREWE